MDTLKEYLKIKEMSNDREIADYIAASLDYSSFAGFCSCLVNYDIILKRIKQEREAFSQACNNLITVLRAQNQAKSENFSKDVSENTGSSGSIASNEARVIPLFPHTPR